MSIRVSAVLLAVLLVFACPLYAQNMGEAATEEGAEDGGSSVKVMEPPDDPNMADEPESDLDESVDQVPTYEGSPQFPDVVHGTPAETYLRLAQDYLYISEIGGNTPGSVPLWPRGELKLGPILIFPYLTGRIGYTSNIYNNETDEASAFTDLGGGVALNWNIAGGKGNLGLGIDYIWRTYFQERDLAYSQWVGGFGFTWNFGRGVWVRVGVKYEYLVDSVKIDQAGQMARHNVLPYIDLGFDELFGNRVQLQVGVNAKSQNFTDEEFENSDNSYLDLYVRVSFPMMKNQTRLYVQYDHYIGYRGPDDDDWLKGGNQLAVGMDGTIPLTRSQRVTGYIQIGYRQDVYDGEVDGRDGSSVDDTDNAGTPTVLAGIRYLPNAKSSAELRLYRTFQFSTSAQNQIKSRVELIYTYNILRDLLARAGIYWERSEPSQGDAIDRLGGGLGVRYLIHENVDLDMALDYVNRVTDRPGLNNDQFIGSLGVTVYFR